MTQQSTCVVLDALLNEWHDQAWWQRLFLPGDFLDNVSLASGENLVCHKTIMEYLNMSDRVGTHTTKVHQSRNYSTDPNYRPQEFKNETLKIMTGSMQVTCGGCSGAGSVSCSTTMNCRECGGSGQREEKCRNCGGSGSVPKMSQGRYGTYQNGDTSCPSCWGRRSFEVHCGRCSGGKVTCNKCHGSGRVECGRCDGAGQLVLTDFITRKFTCSTERKYQLSGLRENEFKNGLAGKHFNSMTGDLIYQQMQQPADANTVLQRQSVHSYEVLSQLYSYEDKAFCVNRITGGGGLKYVTSGLPLAKAKMAVGGGILGVAAAGILALMVLL